MPQGRGPLNYTTMIDPAKTAGECIAALARHGAGKIMMLYGPDRLPSGIAFEIDTQWGHRTYTLPVNVDGTHAALKKARRDGYITPKYTERDQAVRTSWRVLLVWLEAQLALIEAGVSVLEEVMLPWQMIDGDTTVFQAINNKQLMLTSGGEQ